MKIKCCGEGALGEERETNKLICATEAWETQASEAVGAFEELGCKQYCK